MLELISSFAKYLDELLIEGISKAFTLFDILGIILFFFPSPANNLVQNEVTTRIVGGVIFFLSFLLSNFVLYRKYAAIYSEKADIHLEVSDNFFNPSTGTGLAPAKNIQSSPHGFNKQGIPDWSSLYAVILVKNVGYEDGKLAWEFDPKKTEFPPLFNQELIAYEFQVTPTVPARTEKVPAFFFAISFSERDPKRFAHALKKLRESNERYKVVLNYWTRRIDGETRLRRLEIKGNFDKFVEDVIDYWRNFGHQNLVDIASGI
jgi:hypothetical protein